MKKTVLAACTAAFISLFTALSSFAGTTEHTLRSQGIVREYKLYVPENLPAGAPLVIVLHGYGGSNDPDRFGMNAAADRHGFAVCYPLGTKDSKGKTGWNVGYPSQKGMKTDDIKFLGQLKKHLCRTYGFSSGNVFCTGMSNGGDICYLIASLRPDLFAALAPVAGFMSVETMRTDRSKRPVPLFELHGTADKATRWYGDPDNEDGWGAYVPVPSAVQYWAAKGRCIRLERDTLARRTPEDLQVIAHRYTDGTDGTEVWLYESVGGKHSWAKTGTDTCESIWDFFSRYVK